MASQVITSPIGGDSDDEDDDYDGNPDGLPYSSDPTGPCPRCGRVSNFTVGDGFQVRKHTTVTTGTGTTVLRQQRAVPLTCHGCKQGTLVVEEIDTIGGGFGFKAKPLHWWPTPGSAADMSDVPDDIAGAFQEGLRCLSVEAPNAAVAMFRNALAHMVKDKGSAAAKKALERNLAAAITQMVADGSLLPTFDQWATHIRVVGNAGAHQEAYEAVTVEDAQELQNLVMGLIKYLYIDPATLGRLQKPRKRPKTP